MQNFNTIVAELFIEMAKMLQQRIMHYYLKGTIKLSTFTWEFYYNLGELWKMKQLDHIVNKDKTLFVSSHTNMSSIKFF